MTTIVGAQKVPRLYVIRQPADRAHQPTDDPVDTYLARFSSGASRTGMRSVLNRAARRLTGGRYNARTFDWPTMDYARAERLLGEMAVQGFSPAYRRQVRMAVAGLMKVCWRLGLIDATQLARVCDTAPPRGQALPAGRALTSGECAALWRTALDDTSTSGRRDAAILALLYATGMRRNELVHLELRDYDAATGVVRIRRGKGGKQREALVGDAQVRGVIDAWLAVRPPIDRDVRAGRFA